MMFRTLTLFIAIFLAGCAAPVATPKVVSPKPAPVLFSRTLQSQAAVIAPFNPVTRVPQSVGLAWTPPAEPDASLVTAYNLYVSTEPDLSNALVMPVGNVTNAVVSDLLGGNQYYFAVTDLGQDGAESDYSPILPYVPKVVLDLRFAFDQPVKNITTQCSSDLVTWENCTLTESNGMFRVTQKPDAPMMLYRATGTPEIDLP